MSDTTIFYPLLVLGLLILASILFFFSRRPRRSGQDAAADYAAGLNYMVSGDLQMALRKLRDAVRKDTERIDAYLKIGDILRELGNHDQAIKVHRDLTARLNLDPVQHVQILRALVLDYAAKKSYEQALGVIQQIFALKKDDLWAREKELQLYEELGDWNRAAESYKRLSKIKDGVQKSRLALYRVEMGKKLARAGNERDARATFREAMKLDPRCAAAYLEMSESYIREQRPQDALNTLKKFLQAAPEKAALAFESIKELLFTIGEFGEIENVYNQVIARSPENWRAYLALAEIKDKKGELDEAISLCQTILQRNPDYTPARECLVRYYHRSEKTNLAIEQALALINSRQTGGTFACEACGHEQEKPFWYCPSCHRWETVNYE